MNLTISGHHLDVTPALRAYVVAKLERVLRHFDQVIHIKVLLSKRNESEKDRRQHALCSLQVKGSALHAETAHADLYAAIDTLADKLDRVVLSHKTRKQANRNGAVKRNLATVAAV